MNTQNEKDMAEIAKKTERKFYLQIFSFFTAIILFLIIGIVHGIKEDKNSKDHLYAQCYYYSQDLVKKKLKSPKSADFPWYSDSFIKEKSDTITVTAYVDADNSFGANIRVNYIATIKVKDGKPVSGSVTLLE